MGELLPRDREVVRGLRIFRILPARVEEDVPRLLPFFLLEKEDALLDDLVRRLGDGGRRGMLFGRRAFGFRRRRARARDDNEENDGKDGGKDGGNDTEFDSNREVRDERD